MRFGKIMVLFLAISMSTMACGIDLGIPESATPILDSETFRKTEIAQTQAIQDIVDTAVAATLIAIPTDTPIPTKTPQPTSTNTPLDDGTPVAGSTDEEPVDRYDVPVEGQPFLGPVDAPVVIVEFSDFNCGYCRKWHLETFQALMDTYPEQIRFVYRDYPFLSEESFNASIAAQCAYEQGAFWEYQDRLFTRSETKEIETYLLFARELGLDIQGFQSCLDSDRAAGEVMIDAEFASSLGIRGTPTFFINGIPVIGAQPLESFTSIIDQELGE
jgi:protein-disulfide isomerase